MTTKSMQPWTIRNRRLFLAGAVMVSVAIAILVLAVRSTLALDPRAVGCGASQWPTIATFDLDRARDIHSHLPHMKGTPELETDQPAYVVLFDGAIDLPVMGFGKTVKRQSETGVVCVFTNGVPEYYVDVDISNWHA